MAHFLRKVAIIGFIAINSPLMAGKSEEAQVSAAIEKAAAVLKPHAATGSVSAAREAAEILAGLDPQLRDRLLSGAAMASGHAPHR